MCEGYGEDQLHRLIDVLPYASNELTDVFVSVWSLEPTTSPTRYPYCGPYIFSRPNDAGSPNQPI